MKRLKNVYQIGSYLIILILAIYIAFAVFFPKQFNNLNSFRAYIVVSDSMEPKIHVMSMILVDHTKPDELKVDDIITFRHDIDTDKRTDIITHRVAEIETIDGLRQFRTKPENSKLWDNWILYDQDIIGKVIFIIPYIGHLVMLINNNAMPILITLNILVWSAMIYLIIRWKSLKE